MRIYLDHDVSNRLAHLLNAQGHNATTSREEMTTTFRDSAHILHAFDHNRILLTHNQRDFVELHHAWLAWTQAWNLTTQHNGIIVIPQRANWDVYELAHELDHLLKIVDSFNNRLYRWTMETRWIEEHVNEPQ